MAKPAKKRGQSSPATEEMKRHSALLAAELETWPGVSVRPMFGMHGVWHGKKIFAALPRTRSLGLDNAIMLKFAKPSDKLRKQLELDHRILSFSSFAGEGNAQWYQFLIADDSDLRDALVWLAKASEAR